MGRAVVGAAGMGALARGLVVRVVDLAAVRAASEVAMAAVAGAMGRAVVAAVAGMTSGRAAQVSASSSN